MGNVKGIDSNPFLITCAGSKVFLKSKVLAMRKVYFGSVSGGANKFLRLTRPAKSLLTSRANTFAQIE